MSEERPAFFEENPGKLIREHRMHYLLVNAVSRRVRQLQLGEKALALPPDAVNRDSSYIARQEFLEDKLEIIPRQYLPDHYDEFENTVDVLAGETGIAQFMGDDTEDDEEI